MNDKRIKELLETAHEGGFVLPLHPCHICELEDAGYIVDLRTGQIVGTTEQWFGLCSPVVLLLYVTDTVSP